MNSKRMPTAPIALLTACAGSPYGTAARPGRLAARVRQNPEIPDHRPRPT